MFLAGDDFGLLFGCLGFPPSAGIPRSPSASRPLTSSTKGAWLLRGIMEGMSLLPDNAECRAVADELLTRHTLLQPEANITSQIREFLVRTGLVESGDIREEVAPAEGSGNSVDLAALDTLIEVKRRIGDGIVPDGRHVGQLDGYLKAAIDASKGVRIGILTDGKHWVLRWPNAVMR